MNVLTLDKYACCEPTVEALRKSGFKVRIYHGRVFRAAWQDFGEIRSSEVVCSKYDYMRSYGNPAEYVQQDILCRGGFTRIEVTTPNENKPEYPSNSKTYVGKYNFGSRPFNRKIGLKAALGRAMKQLRKDTANG